MDPGRGAPSPHDPEALIVLLRRIPWLTAALCLLASLAWAPAAPADTAGLRGTAASITFTIKRR